MGTDVPNALIRELIAAGLASLYDPQVIDFRRTHEVGVRPIRQLLDLRADKMQKLRRPLSRNAFLCGCLDYTEDQPTEHLIVGYGIAAGRATRVGAVQHVIGEAGSVAVPARLEQAARGFVVSQPRAELIVFHNHPTSWLNAMFDNVPLASSADRRLLLKTKYLQPVMALKGLLGLGGIRFYVGENGFVREIRGPGGLQLLALFDRVSAARD